MNLTQNFPRSPKEKMAGLVHIPRMIDKARARQSNTLGEYIYPCPLDQVILDFLGVDGEEFARVANERDETSIAKWVEEKCRDRAPGEKHAVIEQILQRRPKTEERWKDFLEIRNKIDPSRTDIQTWVDLIDLEERHL